MQIKQPTSSDKEGSTCYLMYHKQILESLSLHAVSRTPEVLSHVVACLLMLNIKQSLNVYKTSAPSNLYIQLPIKIHDIGYKNSNQFDNICH